MTVSLFLNIQQVIMGVMATLGILLLLDIVPEKLKKSDINISSRVIGVGVTLIPITYLIFYLTDLYDAGIRYSIALDLTAYCLSSTLFSTAYYTLLDRRSKPFIKTNLIVGAIYPFPLWLGLHYCPDTIAKHLLIAAYTLYCVIAAIHIFSCLIFYRQKLKLYKINMPGQSTKELALLGRLIYVYSALIAISFITPMVSAYSSICIFLLLTYSLGIIYTCISFHKIVIWGVDSLIDPIPNSLECIVEESSDNPTVLLNESVILTIRKHLQRWVSRKEYLRHDVSINDVAKAAYTNRTYLSRYINSMYNCSFKVWITQLRIEEAKELLRENPELSISEVAAQSGFASMESFSHTFSRHEQLSPSRWREKQLLSSEK